GQVLFSMRELDAIAVLDVEKGTVVWAAQGPWRAQHDPQFLDNGRLLIFDNLGSDRGSRILEYDPVTQALPWSYPEEDGNSFRSTNRGLCQRLHNGNTLIVDSEEQEIFEVTPQKECVWSFSCGGFIQLARRYTADELPFLKKGVHARP